MRGAIRSQYGDAEYCSCSPGEKETRKENDHFDTEIRHAESMTRR